MIVDLIGPNGIVKMETRTDDRDEIYLRLPWWEDQLWLRPMFLRGEGIKAVSILCDLCGNREVAEARYLWLPRRRRRYLVCGYTAEINDSAAIVRRRVALGETPDPEWIENVDDVFALVGKDPGPRVPPGRHAEIAIVQDAVPTTPATAWCRVHQWFDVPMEKLRAAATAFDQRGGRVPRKIRVGEAERWGSLSRRV